ncbi:hypothetical protein [Streptomyces nanshensis]|nr:hypothetical protein [Streptomyces nanshensis]
MSRGPATPWKKCDPITVPRPRARSIVSAWTRERQAHALQDRDGRLFLALPAVQLELAPCKVAPPTEGKALRAALAAGYGFPAYDDGEGGFSWLAVPLDPNRSWTGTYEALHFRVSSGERADRPASEHPAVWGASLYDAEADYVTTLASAPEGSTLAEDCAHVARAIAQYARAVHPCRARP